MKNKEIVIGGVSNKELLMLARQLYAALKSGYNTPQGLELAHHQSRGRLKQILSKSIDDVSHGAYLHEALGKHKKYFPILFINLIKTGELSGSLKETLKRLVSILQKEHEMRQKIRAAMTYPIFVLIAVMALGLAIAIFVLPSLLPLFGSLDIELPASTRLLLWLAAIFENHGLTIVISFIALLIASFLVFRSSFSRPLTHWLKLHIPLFGKVQKQLIMARFGRALASLLRSTVPIDQSLEITTTVISNYYYQKTIKTILPQLKKGQRLSDSLSRHSSLFDSIFIQLLSLGESTAGLEEACDNVADYYEGEVDESMRNLSVSLEPILIIFVGAIVAFVAFSILGPIYKITGNIR